MFDGEFEAIILKILSEYKNNLAITQRQKKILEDIISANPSCEDTALYVDKIKSIFSGYDGVTPKILQELKELKLEIVDGNTHTSIKIIDDPRFEVNFAKTPSDKSRVGKNIIRDIKKNLL